MPSVHVVRWIENLSGTGFDLYWFDVLDRGRLDTSRDITQYTGWKTRKWPRIRGEYKFSRIFPRVYGRLAGQLETTADEALAEIIQTLKPDIVHSFEMQHCSYPILKTMQKFPEIKWIYSCWGSDLFYYKDFDGHRKKITAVLGRVNYLVTDCQRDLHLARSLNFSGKHLGVIPGGGGYQLQELLPFKWPQQQRKMILVKGYQHDFGLAIPVIDALRELGESLGGYEIVVFGAHRPVIDHIKKHNLPYKVFHRNELSPSQVMELMGKSLIYIGNSRSDGLPNTLLEAIVMNAFPLQSNPGGATSEIIRDGHNGLLIHQPENVPAIKETILSAIGDQPRLETAAAANEIIAEKMLDCVKIKADIIKMYQNLS